MSLTQEQLASVSDLDVEEVQVPEWKGSIYLRPMTGRERDQFEVEHSKALRNGGIKENFRSRFLAQVFCDEHSKPIFESVDKGVDILGQRSSKVITRLFDRAWKISGFDEKEVDEFEKN